jgi:anti-repressor protein
MNELIKIETRNEKQYINAKELYEKLGLNKSNWSRWSKNNIEENIYFKENEDYIGFFIMTNGNITKNYWLSLEMAKHLCAQTNTEIAYEYREYLFKVEQAWNTPEMIIKRALEFANRKAEEATQKLLENNHKIEFYDEVTESKNALAMDKVAQILDFKNLGRNKLFNILRENDILKNDNSPYQTFVDRGWFRLIETKFTKPNGDTCVNYKTVVYQKGIEGISNLLKKLGYLRKEKDLIMHMS